MSARTAASPGGVGFAELGPDGQYGSAVVGGPDRLKSVEGLTGGWVVASTRSGVVVAPPCRDVVSPFVAVAVVALIGFVFV